ncbi:MAG: hypothetical protein EBX35_14730 [Planctomycetia bacterium]|nr:hypothetical protein [Planctomycetia bacterium]
MADAVLYDYDLPRELIAQEPLADRSAARLLVVRRGAGSLEHRHVRDLPNLLAPGDLVVVNEGRALSPGGAGRGTGGQLAGARADPRPSGPRRAGRAGRSRGPRRGGDRARGPCRGGRVARATAGRRTGGSGARAGRSRAAARLHPRGRGGGR